MAGEVYSCPACGEAMLCTPELEALRAEVGRLREKLGLTETRLLETVHAGD